MAHEHSILDIYNAKIASADGTVNIHNVPNKRWLGKTYAETTVQRGATRQSGLHANAAGDQPGFSLDGANGAYFDATIGEYDTTPQGASQVYWRKSVEGQSLLDDRGYQQPGMVTVGGDPTADPYVERDYLENAPGLGG